MLRAKKEKQKAEEEAKRLAAAQAAGNGGVVGMDVGNDEKAGGGASTDGPTVSILGIGGQSVKTGQPKGRRRQPAELRIQKGESSQDHHHRPSSS